MDAVEAPIPTELVIDGCVILPGLIVTLGLAKSNSDAKRMMQAGAVSLDGEKATDPTVRFPAVDLVGKTLRVGRHEFRKLV